MRFLLRRPEWERGCHHHIPAPLWQWKATVTTTGPTPPLSNQHQMLHILPAAKTQSISQAFEHPWAFTENRKMTNYLMKNEAAAEVPAETPAGATKLWEATEPPVPVGSELFCPELTWTLGPSRPLSGAVSAWKKEKKTHIQVNTLAWHGAITYSASEECLCKGKREDQQWLRRDTSGQAYHRRSCNREGKNHDCNRQAE